MAAHKDYVEELVPLCTVWNANDYEKYPFLKNLTELTMNQQVHTSTILSVCLLVYLCVDLCVYV